MIPSAVEAKQLDVDRHLRNSGISPPAFHAATKFDASLLCIVSISAVGWAVSGSDDWTLFAFLVSFKGLGSGSESDESCGAIDPFFFER